MLNVEVRVVVLRVGGVHYIQQDWWDVYQMYMYNGYSACLEGPLFEWLKRCVVLGYPGCMAVPAAC